MSTTISQTGPILSFFAFCKTRGMQYLRWLAGGSVFLLACISALFAFPQLHVWLDHWFISLMVCCCFPTMALIGVWAFCRRRWISGCFHLGFAIIVFGGWRSAQSAIEKEFLIPGLPETSTRTFTLEDFSIVVGAFEQENYPHLSTPKQWRTTLLLPTGEHATAQVNQPVRFKGWTIYQMSFGLAGHLPRMPKYYVAPRGYSHMRYDGIDYPLELFVDNLIDLFGPYDYPFYDPDTYAWIFGEHRTPIYYTGLLCRKDPGVKWVFTGYGLLALGALLFALRETRRWK